jgi:hypothetical protein
MKTLSTVTTLVILSFSAPLFASDSGAGPEMFRDIRQAQERAHSAAYKIGPYQENVYHRDAAFEKSDSKENSRTAAVRDRN